MKTKMSIESCRNTKESIVCYGYHQQHVSIDQNYCVFLEKSIWICYCFCYISYLYSNEAISILSLKYLFTLPLNFPYKITKQLWV